MHRQFNPNIEGILPFRTLQCGEQVPGKLEYSVPDLPEVIAASVDRAVDDCFGKTYVTDELFGETLTSIRGPLDSVCKRHGLLLEESIAYALASQESDRFEVSTQVHVVVPQSVIALVEANKLEKLDGLHFPRADAKGYKVVIDILAFDWQTEELHVISVKRGGGAQGGKAAREARKDLVGAGLILKHLMLTKGVPVRKVKTVLVDWYGRSGITARKTVSRETIDGYFGISVAGLVEAMSGRLASSIAKRMMPRLKHALKLAEGASSNREAFDQEVRADLDDDAAAPAGEVDSAMKLPRPTLAECLSVLPLRPQGRQMRSVVA
jgi:hypothetical protein